MGGVSFRLVLETGTFSIFIIGLNDEKNRIYTPFRSIDRQSAGVLLAQQLFAGAKTAHPGH